MSNDTWGTWDVNPDIDDLASISLTHKICIKEKLKDDFDKTIKKQVQRNITREPN